LIQAVRTKNNAKISELRPKLYQINLAQVFNSASYLTLKKTSNHPRLSEPTPECDHYRGPKVRTTEVWVENRNLKQSWSERPAKLFFSDSYETVSSKHLLFITYISGPDQFVVQHEESHSALDLVLALVYLNLNFDLLRITDILRLTFKFSNIFVVPM
jgi:hypothetical protein